MKPCINARVWGTTCIFVCLSALYSAPAQSQDPAAGIIPAPVMVQQGSGKFTLSRQTVIKADNPADKAVVFLTRYVNHLPKTNSAGKSSTVIELTGKGAESLPQEGYKLTVTPARVVITGKGAGLFYGVQSFLQLLPAENNGDAKLPCVTIEDYPRFGYRGVMLDVSRHFFTVQEVKDLIDLMAVYKLNRFHWHLTDDNGWRIAIKKFPKLTSIGAWRVPRYSGYGANEAPRPGEAATDGGFYTQEEIKEVVKYAKDRYIEILPEIDVPGHSLAAIAAYPELCCTKESASVNPGSNFSKWYDNGKYEMLLDNTLNPIDEKVYQFLDEVFTEVAALFPYEYIHIGGDECYKGYWEKDAGIQAFMKEKQMKKSEEVQSYFTTRLGQLLRKKGKKIIGWDEILEGGLAKDAAVMSWRGEQGGIAAAKLKHEVIMSPSTNGLYFDYGEAAPDLLPASMGGYSALYRYDPVPKSLTPEERPYILGVQGNIWTEFIATVPRMHYMILPRMLALAELAWTPADQKDYNSFSETRLPVQLARFDKLGYNYRVPAAFIPTDTTMTGERFSLKLKPAVPGAKIYFTLNGKAPDITDREYSNAFTFIVPPNEKKIFQAIVVTPSGKRSAISRIVLENKK
ncbi:family 20 glycosylhydrolase [Chitinophaga sp. 22321]|uniref:beta-N-acetylhexosaminidase n=1 Tax=Chitinophaga hostae TaxID=2831022 RepID=A0ABS5J3T4_9BACT|nr:family 20 glycosylhydrolase [Chitinophaga hostae]MBS0029879.1 family 20 glycosylhydrolase [Chitinophaga hostae]